MRRAVPLLVCLAALAAPGAVAADLHSRTLANGLRVIVKEDVRDWYAGSTGCPSTGSPTFPPGSSG